MKPNTALSRKAAKRAPDLATESTSLSEHAYQRLRSAIQSSELKPGQRVMEEIAKWGQVIAAARIEFD